MGEFDIPEPTITLSEALCIFKSVLDESHYEPGSPLSASEIPTLSTECLSDRTCHLMRLDKMAWRAWKLHPELAPFYYKRLLTEQYRDEQIEVTRELVKRSPWYIRRSEAENV